MNSCKTLLGIFTLLTLVVVTFLVFFPMGYLYATYENLYGEWLQFAAFVGIVVYSFKIVKQHGAWKNWFWVLLLIGAFYVAGEEISWGQQVFGWKSMEFFQKHNLQGETNLHNMLTGPYSTLKKDILTYGLSFGIFCFGVIYPLFKQFNIGIARFFEEKGIPVPPLCLLPFFVVAAFCELGLYHFNEAELAELFVALAMLFFAVTYFYQHKSDKKHDHLKLGSVYIVVFVVALVSSFALTQISIHSSDSKQRVANRIEAGTKKFAGRYARVKAWDHAVDLYQRHLAYEPESRSRMRRLARAYKSAGRPADYEAAMQQALNIDLEQLKRNSQSASVHRSLYKTYKAMDDMSNAAKHISEALKINQRTVRAKPNSASAAYSIAQTYDLLGRHAEAVIHYKRAFDLKPGSSRYRRAYRDATE